MQTSFPIRPGRFWNTRAVRTGWASLLMFGLALAVPTPVEALIEGGEGNQPLRDPGWPEGAAAVFNTEQRVAYWVGPPFGGGHWHAECRGTTEQFNELLKAFAQIKTERRVLVVHDGFGRSFWLNPNDDPKQRQQARIDWMFEVWQPDVWKQHQRMPARYRPPGGADGKLPAPQIDVYVGGSIDWSHVEVPQGITVDDQRLVAHGFQPTDGTVIEGTVRTLEGQPLADVEIQLQLVKPQEKGGYEYEAGPSVTSDAEGHWVMTKTPEGWFRLVARHDAFVPRVFSYEKYRGEPRWYEYHTRLVGGANVTGRVEDAEGQPLAGVTVRLIDTTVADDTSYNSPEEFSLTTDATGKFAFDGVPSGKVAIGLGKEGYCRPGLRPVVPAPSQDLSLKMLKSAQLKVRVNFSATPRPRGYLVSIEEQGGAKVGSWGGSANLKPEGFVEFKNIPPGLYVVKGRPNPGSSREETDPKLLELKGGEQIELELVAKPKPAR